MQERKAEIDSLRRQLSEFEESAQPLRTYALAGAREREAGGVSVLDRDTAPLKLPSSWSKDWSSMQLQRCAGGSHSTQANLCLGFHHCTTDTCIPVAQRGTSKVAITLDPSWQCPRCD